MSTFVLTGEILNTYREVAEVMNSTQEYKDVRKVTMKQMMQESFFRGSSVFGYNFIA